MPIALSVLDSEVIDATLESSFYQSKVEKMKEEEELMLALVIVDGSWNRGPLRLVRKLEAAGDTGEIIPG